MPILANVIEDAFSPLISLFESIMVFIHATSWSGAGARDRGADRADPRGAGATDLQAAEVDAGNAAAGAGDQRAEREVQGGQTAPAAGDHEVLPGEQNQSPGLLPAAAAAAAGVHLAVLHAAHGPEDRHLRAAAASPTTTRCTAPARLRPRAPCAQESHVPTQVRRNRLQRSRRARPNSCSSRTSRRRRPASC